MEFKKYKMAMSNRIRPKNRDFVIDRERAPFDDNVETGEGMYDAGGFMTTPQVDPREFPARKEYMQSYAVGGNVRKLLGIGGGAIEGTDLGTREGFAGVRYNMTKTDTPYLKTFTDKQGKNKRYHVQFTRQGYNKRFTAPYNSEGLKAAVEKIKEFEKDYNQKFEGKIKNPTIKKLINPPDPNKPWRYKGYKKVKYFNTEQAAVNFQNKILKEREEKRAKPITKEEKNLVKKQYEEGKNLAQISRDNDISIKRVEKAFKEQGLKLRESYLDDPKNFDYVQKNYRDKTYETMAKELFPDENLKTAKSRIARLNKEVLKQPENEKVASAQKKEVVEKYGYNPDESKAAAKKARKEAIKKRSLPAFERMMTGTTASQLSHMDDIYNIDIGLGDLSYSPDIVNQTLLQNVDPYLKTLNEKRAKLLKYKPKGWQKALEEINQKGMDAAAATRGYKSFTIINPDGTTFKYGGNPLFSLDPLGEYEGKSLQEAFPTKIKTNELAVRQYFPDEAKRAVFLENAMNIHKAQQTGNLEEIKKINKDLFDLKFNDEKTFNEVNEKINKLEGVSDISDDLLCTIGRANQAQFYKRDTLKKALKAEGGRIGFKKGHTPECIEAGKKKIEEGRIGRSEINAVEKSLTESGKMTPAAKKFFTTAKTALRTGARIPAELISIGFGPAGVVAGALLELATVQDDIMRGDLKEAWRNTFPGMILKGAENLAGVDLTGSKRTDILKYAKTDEERASVNSMFDYLEGTEKYNEKVGDLELIGGDILANEQMQEPEADLMTSLSSQQFYDTEDQARKLQKILDAQEKVLGTAQGQKMGIDVLMREIEGRYPLAKKLNPNLSLEQFKDDEINRIYFGIQKQAAPIPDIIDPETEFLRQPFAEGGLSTEAQIQKLLDLIPGLMIADFVPISEKVQLKRLFDQFNDRYMRKADGGRIGFANGPDDINKSRRLFNQLLLGLATLPVVGKYLKLGRGAAKAAVSIPKTAGMPEFFEPLVNKVINEGIDVTKKMGTQERQVVHKADIADHEVTVYRQLDTGEVDVYINGMKTLYQDAVRLYYKPGQVSEEASKAAGRTVREPDEFIAQESSPAYSGSPEDYEITSDGTFETNNFNELASDLSEVEAAVMKKPVTELQKRKKLERLNYYESKEGTQKLLDEQYGEYDDSYNPDELITDE